MAVIFEPYPESGEARELEEHCPLELGDRARGRSASSRGGRRRRSCRRSRVRASAPCAWRMSSRMSLSARAMRYRTPIAVGASYLDHRRVGGGIVVDDHGRLHRTPDAPEAERYSRDSRRDPGFEGRPPSRRRSRSARNRSQSASPSPMRWKTNVSTAIRPPTPERTRDRRRPPRARGGRALR